MDKINYLKPQIKVRTIEGECLMQDGSPSVETPFDPKDPTQDVFAREGDYDEENNPFSVLYGTTDFMVPLLK